jgi:hypothetical protein
MPINDHPVRHGSIRFEDGEIGPNEPLLPPVGHHLGRASDDRAGDGGGTRSQKVSHSISQKSGGEATREMYAAVA